MFGLIEDTNLVGNEFSWLGSIVYVAQLVAQPLVAWCLVKLPLGKFLAVTVFFWGAILSIMPAAHNFGGLLALRFLLGLGEAGVAPAFISVTQVFSPVLDLRNGKLTTGKDVVAQERATGSPGCLVCHEVSIPSIQRN